VRYLAAFAAALVLAGCAPQTLPTPEQNAAAIQAGWNDKQERIVSAALQGMWIGDKGSVLTVGPGHHMTERIGSNGKTVKGDYKLEAYKVILNGHAIGWITMTNPDAFFIAKSREDVEHFRRIAS